MHLSQARDPKKVVLLRSGKKKGLVLEIDHCSPTICLDLFAGKENLIAGKWQTEITIDNQPLAIHGDWEENCRFIDADVDYIELESSCDEGVVLQRQFVLARKQKFLFIADAILAPGLSRMEYRSSIPLTKQFASSSSKNSAARSTNEIGLVSKKQRAVVLPLALSEWASEKRNGTLRIDNGQLAYNVIRQQGASLYAPLWIDLNEDRFGEDLTWRHLSVAEQRQNISQDMAAGYRVQIGKKQWLVYRALASKANRTILGHNLITEFLLAKFGKKGKITPVMQVE